MDSKKEKSFEFETENGTANATPVGEEFSGKQGTPEFYEMLRGEGSTFDRQTKVTVGPLLISVFSTLLLGVNPCSGANLEEVSKKTHECVNKIDDLGLISLLEEAGSNGSPLNKVLMKAIEHGEMKGLGFDEIVRLVIVYLCAAFGGIPALLYSCECRAEKLRLRAMGESNRKSMDGVVDLVNMLREMGGSN